MDLTIPDTVREMFSKRINILIVEDDEYLLSTLAELFSTPCTAVTRAASMAEARNVIARSSDTWHCWIVDLCLGGKQDAGMALIEENSGFPFAIVYSGIGSMESASHATQMGAEAVIDKGGDSIAKLICEVCELAPLAVLCKGAVVKSKEVLFLLKSRIIRQPNAWARAAGITLRQLQNVSTLQTGIPPSLVIPFYYGLRHLLYTCLAAKAAPVERSDETFYQDCMSFLEKNPHLYKKVF